MFRFRGGIWVTIVMLIMAFVLVALFIMKMDKLQTERNSYEKQTLMDKIQMCQEIINYSKDKERLIYYESTNDSLGVIIDKMAEERKIRKEYEKTLELWTKQFAEKCNIGSK